MKTDELIFRLASGAGPTKKLEIGRDLTLVVCAGLILCSVLSLGVRGLVPEAMWTGAALWTKLFYTLALAACSAWLFHLLAFPGKRIVPAFRAALLVALLMALAGALSVFSVPPEERLTALMGKTALICPWVIPLLSLPTLGALFHLMKRFAPTELRWVGMVSGLLAGSVGAAGYALSCVEQSISFVAVWYSVGILLSAGLGAVLGPRFLRW
ncbi:MAG: DUF1109 domain-containing protein [Beijerinckiaceae bacterium]